MSAVEEQKDRGPWFQTASGRVFYPYDPKVSEIFLSDIARALAMQCRFNGHCEAFYSIAEHSRWISLRLAPVEELDALERATSATGVSAYKYQVGLGLYGLLHDAAEAYVGDMVSPVKARLSAYRAVEDRVQAAIAARFGFASYEASGSVHLDCYPILKEADRRMLLTEKRDLRKGPLHKTPDEERAGLLPYEDLKLRGEAPAAAEELFLARFQELWKRQTGVLWDDDEMEYGEDAGILP